MWWSTTPDNCGLDVSVGLTSRNVDIILKLQACTWQLEQCLGETWLHSDTWRTDLWVRGSSRGRQTPGLSNYLNTGDPLTLDVTGLQGRKWMLGMLRKMESISGTLGSSRINGCTFAVYKPLCA